MKNNHEIFRSKGNTMLLIILIILMIIALRWMSENRDLYPRSVQGEQQTITPRPNTYTQTRDNPNGPDYQPKPNFKTEIFLGVTFDYPSNFTLKKIEGGIQLDLCLKDSCDLSIAPTPIEDKKGYEVGDSFDKVKTVGSVDFVLRIGASKQASDAFDQIVLSAKKI